MHVAAKRIAVLGLSMALAIILIVLSGIIEVNTFFLLAAASFFTGIAIYEFGVGSGAAFCAGSVLLGFILAPNKFYVITYFGLSFYILAVEFVWKVLFKQNYSKKNRSIVLVLKFVLFNILYIPVLWFFPSMLLTVKMSTPMFLLLLLGGQLILLVYDKAYEYFMVHYWIKFRRRLGL